MKNEDFKKDFSRLWDKFVTVGVSQKEASIIIEGTLQQGWINKLLVFSDYAIFIADNKRLKYLYVSPSIENICGYKNDEFTDVYSLVKIFDEKELKIILQIAELVLAKISILSFTADSFSRLRFTRNNWGKDINGNLKNFLQHSMGLTFSEQGMIQIELIIITDITSFNNSPNHFYKLSKVNTHGSEEILLQGVFEKEIITPREREIFSLITLGKTSEEISAQLNISTETVKSHRKNLLEKTNSENSIDLLRYGYAQGWL